MKLYVSAIFLSMFLIWPAAAWSAAAPDTLCLSCHDEKGSPFHASVHSSLGCTGCHTDIKAFPHPDNVAKVNCGACHSEAATALAGSVHAKASEQPCLSCHGDAHAIVDVKDPKSTVYPLNLPRTCGACHGNKKFAEEHHLPDVYSEYMDSIHGFALTKDGLLVAATCSSCHGSHDILAPTNPKSRTYRANVPATCGTCHEGIQQLYFAGIHGKQMEAGNAQAPVCTNCHTAHQISNVREVSFQMKTSATCGNCHRERFGTYRDTFHAQVSALGYVETAHCWDCHRAHDILPASDPKSTVAKANLVQTCGQCHSGVSASFVSYSPHADPHDGRQFPALHAASIFMNLLLASLLGFMALHTVLWFIRSHAERLNDKRRNS
ncbi:MAG TPA: cytochrome c3 family protein [Bryobacteraceae bacterium]|nr:cytochrome c3 family protein [Bryobacteraceae bacterium]